LEKFFYVFYTLDEVLLRAYLWILSLDPAVDCRSKRLLLLRIFGSRNQIELILRNLGLVGENWRQKGLLGLLHNLSVWKLSELSLIALHLVHLVHQRMVLGVHPVVRERVLYERSAHHPEVALHLRERRVHIHRHDRTVLEHLRVPR